MSPRRSNPWLKHPTDFRNEPDNIDLMESFGHAGYSIHIRIREIVGANIDETTASARYPLNHWLQELRTKRQKLYEILDFLEEVGRISYEVDAKHLEISYPQLFALRSEYAQKRDRKFKKANAAGTEKRPDKQPDNRRDSVRREQSEKQTIKTASRSARSSTSRVPRGGPLGGAAAQHAMGMTTSPSPAAAAVAVTPRVHEAVPSSSAPNVAADASSPEFAAPVAPPPLEGPKYPSFKRGQRVWHEQFRTGTVLTVEGYGGTAKVVVYFSDIGVTRTFVVMHAKLHIGKPPAEGGERSEA